MKICLISNLYPPYVLGGAEVYVQRIARGLARDNEVTVITQQPFTGLTSLRGQAEFEDGVKVCRFYPLNVYFTGYSRQAPQWLMPVWHLFNLWNPHPYREIRRILKRETPDIVHSHITSGFSLSVFSAVKSLRYPHIHTCHGYALLSPWSALMRNGKIISRFNFWDRQFMKITRHFSKTAAVVSAPSQFVLDKHRENGFFPASKAVKIPIGIELGPYTGDKKGKESQTVDILYTGQLTTTKGVHTLIDSFRRLNGEKVRLHITGKGDQEAELKEAATEDSRITFHGFVSREQLAELYRQADLAVFPSLFYENAPAVILESFRAGTPVIGSRIGGIPEIIEEDKNGRLFSPGNSDELTAILESLVNNPAELRRLGEEAIRSVQRYDINEHIKQLLTLYEEVRSRQCPSQ